MKILDYFLFKALLRNTFLVLFVLVLIFTIFQFIHELQYIGIKQNDLTSTLLYLIFQMPLYISMMSGIALIIGSIITISSLKSELEIIPIYFSGLSKKQISKKFLYFLSFFSLIFFSIGELATMSSLKADIFRSNKLGIESTVTKNSSNYWIKRNNEIVSVSKFQSDDNHHIIKVFELNETNTLSGYRTYKSEGEKFLTKYGLNFKSLNDKYQIDILKNKDFENFQIEIFAFNPTNYLNTIDLINMVYLNKDDLKIINEIQNRILIPIFTLLITFTAIVVLLRISNSFSLTRQITIGVILSVLVFYLIRLLSLFTQLEILSVFTIIFIIMVMLALSILLYKKF